MFIFAVHHINFYFQTLSQHYILWLLIISFSSLAVFSQNQINQPDEKTIIIEDAPEMEVFAIGKNVIVKSKVKGVLAFGGNITIEGEVTGDVAAIGGSVFQKEKAFIGGDVIIFGGKYQPEAKKPLRNENKETVMYAGYENELKDLMQNPAQILTPDFSISFLAQRILSVLFWFIISLAITTITPGAVTRASVNFKLSTLKIFGVGALTLTVVLLAVLFSLEFLPSFVSAVVGLMSFVLIMLAYVFGRVVLQASIGKWVTNKLKIKTMQSETFSLLIGTIIWVVLLSVPYIWVLALFTLFIASLGIVITVRSAKNGHSTQQSF